MEKEIKFKFERETKGAVRYMEVDDKGNKAEEYSIGTLYVRKSTLGDKLPPPKTITVTIKGDK